MTGPSGKLRPQLTPSCRPPLNTKDAFARAATAAPDCMSTRRHCTPAPSRGKAETPAAGRHRGRGRSPPSAHPSRRRRAPAEPRPRLTGAAPASLAFRPVRALRSTSETEGRLVPCTCTGAGRAPSRFVTVHRASRTRESPPSVHHIPASFVVLFLMHHREDRGHRERNVRR